MVTIEKTREECLARFGFSFDRGGAHLARSMMLDEISRLLQHQVDQASQRSDYEAAVLEDNCLGKRSARSRQLTLRHLKSLYALDPTVSLFRAFRYFWHRDSEGHPLLACLMAYSRDAMLRASAQYILRLPIGSKLERAKLEEFIDSLDEGRFSQATLKSTAQNLSTTWTHSGHVAGRVNKTRSTANATPGSASLALFMGYIAGGRGQKIFETEYCKLLDCTPDRTIELAESASRKGWIVCKRIGNVIEVLFPNLLTPEEQEWVHEQS